eukprot:symbB.v1.2.006633.t2/scaffold390.1/size254036/29
MNDLLRPNFEALRVKELPQRGLFVDGLSREYVTCPADVMAVIRAGLRARVVGKTRCNLHSSRSHVIFVLHVEQSSPQSDEKLGKPAANEKVSKSECFGETFEEAKKINWSLSALGKVIDALAEQRPHVPYRDSQLTRVLQEALGGNCRTTLLVAASSCAQHADETLSSLRFATRAKSVRNVAKVNYTYSPEQLLLLVAKLQKQLVGAHQHIMELGQLRPESAVSERTFRPSSSRLSRRLTSKVDAVSEEASASASTRPATDFSESVQATNEDEDVDMEAVAQDAVSSFEATLLAQEKSLAEVRLLRASREDGADRSDHSGSDGHDLMAERFKALQYGVNARSYQWRWHLEKYRCESLSMELKMRKKISQDTSSLNNDDVESIFPFGCNMDSPEKSDGETLTTCRMPWCRVILVEPRDARNVVHSSKLQAANGRAGRSFEKAQQLGLADSLEDSSTALDLSAWKGCERLATEEGAEVLQSAKLYGSLKAALTGTGQSVAFSGRQGRNFRQPTADLKVFATKLAEKHQVQGQGTADAKTALDVGLSTEAVLMCTDVCRLRTSDCPSLNLSHAVAVVLSRVFEEVLDKVLDAGGGEVNRIASPSPEKAASVASAWTADWSELCRQRLEVQGYPTQAELWHGRVVADCVRCLQRLSPTESEVVSWSKLVQALSSQGASDAQDPAGESDDAEDSHEKKVASPKAKASIHCAPSKTAHLAEIPCQSTTSAGTLRAPQGKPRIARPVPRKQSTPSSSKVDTPRQTMVKTQSPIKCLVDTPPAAGTGDTGGDFNGSERCSDAREKTAASSDNLVKSRIEAIQQSYDALQIEFQWQQDLLERRNVKLQETVNRFHAKDLEVSALRHEIQIKDALLGCLQEEERRHFELEEFELGTVLEKALTPLTAILTREQVGRAEKIEQAIPKAALSAR